MMKDATITIARVTSNERDDFVTIRVKIPSTEKGRGALYYSVQMEPADFAYALTGRAETPCKVGS